MDDGKIMCALWYTVLPCRMNDGNYCTLARATCIEIEREDYLSEGNSIYVFLRHSQYKNTLGGRMA
jgi:hypothetical protein